MDVPPLYPAKKERPYPPLTDAERSTIKALWDEGLSALAIARKIDRDHKTIVKALGNVYHSNRPTANEQADIHALWDQGLSVPQISARIGRGRAAVVTALGTAYDAKRHSPRRHGGFGTPEYKAWECMKSRCYKPADKCYYLYGARGITVCDAWRSPTGFPQFLADVGPRPSPQHTLDRRDPNGHYEPGNVRWATPLEQAETRRTTIWLTIDGTNRTLTHWCRELGQNAHKVRERLRLGWTAEEALELVPRTTPRRSPRGNNRDA